MRKLVIMKTPTNIHKLNGVEVVLKCPQLGNFESVKILCFSGASFANFKCGSSQGRSMTFLYGNYKYAPVA